MSAMTRAFDVVPFWLVTIVVSSQLRRVLRDTLLEEGLPAGAVGKALEQGGTVPGSHASASATSR